MLNILSCQTNFLSIVFPKFADLFRKTDYCPLNEWSQITVTSLHPYFIQSTLE